MSRPHSFIGRSKPRVQMALNRLGQLVASTLNTALNVYGSSFVYRPGGASDGNVFAVWSELVAAASEQQGYKLVLLDDTYQDPIIPAGTWDLGGYTVLHGRQRGDASKVCRCIFADGARLVSVYEFHMLDVESQSSAPVLRTSDLPDTIGSVAVYRAGKGTKLYATGSAPLFVEDGGPLNAHWWLTEDAEFVSAAQPVAIAQGRGTGIVVYAADRSVIGKDTMQALPNATIDGVYASVEAYIAKDQFGSPLPTTGIRILEGSGSPEGSEVGSIGDMYVDRTTGGRTLYVKESGNDTNTGWNPK